MENNQQIKLCSFSAQSCARMAALYARGRLGLNEETQVGPYRAVVPTISGMACITGFASYVLDPEYPFPQGFRVGDIW